MEKIFRQVKASERLPENEGTYFVFTESKEQTYDYYFKDSGFSRNVEYWLKPSDTAVGMGCTQKDYTGLGCPIPGGTECQRCNYFQSQPQKSDRKIPKDWKGTKLEWREIVTLEYVISQGYQNEGDEDRYSELHMNGWFGQKADSKGAEEFGIHNATTISLGFWDKIRVLFRQKIYVHIALIVDNEVKVLKTEANTKVPRFIKLKSRKYSYSLSINQGKSTNK